MRHGPRPRRLLLHLLLLHLCCAYCTCCASCLGLTPELPRAARRALRRRKRPEEAQAPSWGAAKGGGHFERAAALLHLLDEVAVARASELVGLSKARRRRVGSRTRPAWEPAC